MSVNLTPENDTENANHVNNPNQVTQGDEWKFRGPAGT
jgi:hypothetical protein